MNPSNWHFTLMAPYYEWIGGLLNRSPLVKLFQARDGQRVLDVGGGTGYLYSLFDHVRFDSWVVLDVNRNMIEQGRKKHPACTFVRGSALHLPFGNEQFDRVLIADALHHMPEPNLVLRECRRVLKGNGRFLVEEFDPARPIGGLIEAGEHLAGMGSRFYTPNQLEERARHAGFRNLSTSRRQYLYYQVYR